GRTAGGRPRITLPAVPRRERSRRAGLRAGSGRGRLCRRLWTRGIRGAHAPRRGPDRIHGPDRRAGDRARAAGLADRPRPPPPRTILRRGGAAGPAEGSAAPDPQGLLPAVNPAEPATP